MVKAKKIICLFLIFMLIFGVFGCNNGDNNSKNINVEIWSYNNAERILKDKIYDDAQKQIGQLSILAVKNETEGAQIIFTPDNDVNGYNFVCNDLTNDNGDVLSKDVFTIYHQMYQEVKNGSDGYSSGTGFYPDALLPIDVANAYGETKLKAGENQGVSVIAKIPSKQPSGLYTGKFSLTVGDRSYDVPTQVQVINYILTDSVSAKSSFNLERKYLAVMGDSTMENYARYYDYLVDHNVMPLYLPTLTDDIDLYTSKAIEFSKRNDISSIGLPYESRYNESIRKTDIDWARLIKQTEMLAKKSIESNQNAVKKCYYYFGGVVDEAELNKTTDNAIRINNEYHIIINELADSITNDSSIMGDNKAEVVASIRKIPCLQTDKYNDKMYNQGQGVRNWCPKFDNFDSPSKREVYAKLAKEDEQWWYGCIGPNNPYPTYQIDDNLISSRIVSWMQQDYNISGNLYWCTNFWLKYRNKQQERTDIYHGDPMFFSGDNGDGVLLYPGDYYNIDGPVGSIRLESIRDGLEEYEILADIENNYKKLGLNNDNVMQYFLTKLYTDAMVKTDSNEFMAVRKNMYEIASLFYGCDTYIKDVVRELDKSIYTVLSNNATQIFVNGKKIEGKVSSKKGYLLYEIEVDYSNDTNIFNLIAKKGDDIATFTDYLGGKTTVINDFENEKCLEDFNAKNTEFSIVDGNGLGFTSNVLKIDIVGGDSFSQYVYIKSSKLNDLLTAKSLKFEINADRDVILDIYLLIKGKPILNQVGFVYLKEGYQIVDFDKISGAKSGEVDKLVLKFGKKGDANRTIYIDSLMLQN